MAEPIHLQLLADFFNRIGQEATSGHHALPAHLCLIITSHAPSAVGCAFYCRDWSRCPINLSRFAKKLFCEFFKLLFQPVIRAFLCHSQASKRCNAQIFAIH
jgi:hypothetical protein